LLTLLLSLLELVEPVIVVPVGGRTVGVSTAVEVMSVEDSKLVWSHQEVERDIVGSVAPPMESEDAGDDEVAETGEEIRVMAKMEPMSPEYPNNPDPHIKSHLGT
jgi:hypothetical protein